MLVLSILANYERYNARARSEARRPSDVLLLGLGAPTILLRKRHTHKMATKTSGNAGRALSFAIDSLTEFICSKVSISISYRVDWCINHRLHSYQFVGRCDEEEEEKEKDRGVCLTDFRV